MDFTEFKRRIIEIEKTDTYVWLWFFQPYKYVEDRLPRPCATYSCIGIPTDKYDSSKIYKLSIFDNYLTKNFDKKHKYIIQEKSLE